MHSVEQAPMHLPLWELIRNDLGCPSAERIARAIGVSASTVHRWNASGSAPRVACLALFWLTRWGRSEVDTQAHNDAVLSAQLARSLREERDTLRDQIAGLHILVASRENELEDARHALKKLQIVHGSGCSAPLSRTGMDPADWLAAAAQALAPALAGFAAIARRPEDQVPPSPQTFPALPEVSPAAALAPLVFPTLHGDPGSPATPPQAESSGKSPTTERSVQPPASGVPEAASSSPSGGPKAMWCHDATTLPPSRRLPPVLQTGGARQPEPASAHDAPSAPARQAPTAAEAPDLRAPRAAPGASAPLYLTRVVSGRITTRRVLEQPSGQGRPGDHLGPLDPPSQQRPPQVTADPTGIGNSQQPGDHR